MGAAPSIPPTTPLAEFRTLVVPPGRGAAIVALALLALAAILPATGDEYRLVLATDILVFALFAASLQFVMGTGGMASFGHAAYFGLGAYAAALGVKHGLPMEAALGLGAPRRDGRGARRGRVLRPALRRLPRDADARVRADRLVDRLPVERRHRRLERRRRRLARRVARRQDRLLLVRTRARRNVACGDRVDRAHAVRLFAARLPGFAATCRRHRHRRAQDAVDRVRAGRRLRRTRRRPLRVFEGQHFAGDARDSALGRRAGDGIARRSQCLARPPARGGGLHVALRHAGARHPVLARGAGRCDHRDRRRGARWHRRRAVVGCWPGGRDERRRAAPRREGAPRGARSATSTGSRPSARRAPRRAADEIIRRRRRGPRRVIRGRGRRVGRADRAERRRQDHLLQSDRRSARARRRHRDVSPARGSTACRRAPSREWASAGRSRWPPRSRR